MPTKAKNFKAIIFTYFYYSPLFEANEKLFRDGYV